MSAQNVVEAAASFGRATGSAALNNQEGILAVFNSVHERSFSLEAGKALKISAPAAHIS